MRGVRVWMVCVVRVWKVSGLRVCFAILILFPFLQYPGLLEAHKLTGHKTEIEDIACHPSDLKVFYSITISHNIYEGGCPQGMIVSTLV